VQCKNAGAVAHLAGAMAKPVWLLLPFIPNWRWMLDREDTPWYPTMRLFRQQQLGDWQSVFAKVASALNTKARTTDSMVKERSETDKIKGLAIGWPVGSTIGWGVYGLNLALQLRQKPGFDVLLLSTPAMSNLVNPLHQVLLRPLMAKQQQIQTAIDQNPGKQIGFNVPVLQALGNNFFSTGKMNLVGKQTVGMIFFENTQLTPDAIARAKSYDLIVAGSTWNAEVLKSNGLNHVAAIFQGIDPTIFHPAPKSNLFADRFVIFSGGKLEYRKGQDIAFAAFKRFQQRHPEALLMTAWHNLWPQLMAGLEQTGNVVGLPQVTQDKHLRITEWLVANGIPGEAVIDIGPIPNYLVGQIIREADVAVFTNRCEGGTNLAVMECLACGIPTIISANTGHIDIIGDSHCYPLRKQDAVQPTAIFPGVEGWGESDVEEVVENLEKVYKDREAAKKRGQAAVEFMQDLTWEKQVDLLLKAIADVVWLREKENRGMEKIDLDLKYPPSEKAEEVKTMVSSFSVIIPAYNCQKVVSKTIESIIESIDYFYANCDRPEEVKSEIVVVNDCSTDNTLYILSQFVGKKYPFKIVNHPQCRGAGATRNTGVKNSQGELLFFCDGDDLYLPEHIYLCFMILNDDPDSSNADGSFALGDRTIKLSQNRLDGIRTGVKIKDRIDPNFKLRIENSLTLNLCLRRECHEFIEGYPEDLVYKQIGGREDCAYHEYLSRFFKIGKISIETVEYIRYPGNSLDRQIVRAETGEGMPEEERKLHVLASQIEETKLAYLIDK